MTHAPARRAPDAVVIRARFAERSAASVLRDELVARGYETQLLSSETGLTLVTVRTWRVLRAEVDGLIWLRGGQPM